MPTSITPISMGCSANAAKAKAVIASKMKWDVQNLASIRSKYGAMSL
jgi:hypothetical protein